VDSSSYVLFYSKTTVDVFARQTISDPQAWPHFMRRFSASGSMIQTDNSIMGGGVEGISPKKIQKYKKQEKEEEEDGSGHSVTSLAQNEEIQKEGNENTEQNIDITTLHFNSNMTKPKLRTTLQSVTTERGGGILKRGKIKQSVGALPKDETPMTPGNERNSVDSPRIATEKSNHILAVEYKAPNKSKYEYRSREASEDNSTSRKEPQMLQKNQSFIQMNFSQDMNEQYYAKPIFGINPKFKTSQSRLSNNSEIRQHSYAK